jgi:hypothetical protein
MSPVVGLVDDGCDDLPTVSAIRFPSEELIRGAAECPLLAVPAGERAPDKGRTAKGKSEQQDHQAGDQPAPLIQHQECDPSHQGEYRDQEMSREAKRCGSPRSNARAHSRPLPNAQVLP